MVSVPAWTVVPRCFLSALLAWQPFFKMLDHDVKGTLLLASEGINGTISGTRQGIDTVLDYLRSIEAIGTFTFKESYTDAQPFYRTKVKLKKEIVTMGVENIDPLESVGRYVKPILTFIHICCVCLVYNMFIIAFYNLLFRLYFQVLCVFVCGFAFKL